jgi:hypothetical protein
LNRIIIFVILVTIVLSSIDYGLLMNESNEVYEENVDNLMSETRQLKIVQLSSNVRSFINIANGLEFDRYDGTPL